MTLPPYMRELIDARAENERLRTLSQNNAHSWDIIVKERNELRAEIERLRRHRTELDCRYTMGDVADLSGSHCSPDEPCLRCKVERLTAELKQRNADYGQLVDLVNRAALEDAKPMSENKDA